MDKIKQFFNDMNQKGIPVPMARDPKSGQGSITATMFIMTHVACILLLLGKVTNVVGNVDYSQLLWLYGLTGSFYLGRKISGNGKDITVGESVDKKEDQ